VRLLGLAYGAARREDGVGRSHCRGLFDVVVELWDPSHADFNDTGRTGGEQTVVRNSQEALPSLLLTFSKVSWRLLEMFRSSGSEPLQTELCENPILSRRVITPTFRGACLSSTSHMPIGIAFNLTLKSYPTRCGCLPNRSRVLAKPQLKRMNKAEGREWLPGG
jgi:hypothetical protein